MTNNKILYGLAVVAGAAIAIWAGLPPIFLLFLACPIAMMFMMGGMGGMHGGRDEMEMRPKDHDAEDAPNTRHPGHFHGSSDRIDRP